MIHQLKQETMNRNFSNLNSYINELYLDTYYQPDTVGHHTLSQELIDKFISKISYTTILDLGCGTGFFDVLLKPYKISYQGITLNRIEAEEAKKLGRNVLEMDFSFLEFPDNSFDLLLSRHSLEHAFSALTTLMEWHRVSRRHLCLVVPNPEHYTYVGRNHYSVANVNQNVWWLRRAGWKLKKINVTETEFWFLCEKKPRISYEGWAKAPLHSYLHDFERDLKYLHGELNVSKYFADREWNELF